MRGGASTGARHTPQREGHGETQGASRPRLAPSRFAISVALGALPLHRLGWAMGVAALATATAAARTTTTGPATTARTPAAAATARPRRLRIRHLDGDPTTVQLTTVELGDRVLGSLRRVHLDEAEPARLAGEAVGDDGRRQHVAALAEELSQAITGSGVRKTADIQLGRHRNPRSLPLIGHAPRTGRDVTPEARSVRSVRRTYKVYTRFREAQVHGGPRTAGSLRETRQRQGLGRVALGADRQQRLGAVGRDRRCGPPAMLVGRAGRQLERGHAHRDRQHACGQPASEHSPHRATFSSSSWTVTGRASTRKPASSKATRLSSDASGATVTTTGTCGATRSNSVTCSRSVRRRAPASATMSDTGSESSTRTPSQRFSASATPTSWPRQARPSRSRVTRS